MIKTLLMVLIAAVLVVRPGMALATDHDKYREKFAAFEFAGIDEYHPDFSIEDANLNRYSRALAEADANLDGYRQVLALAITDLERGGPGAEQRTAARLRAFGAVSLGDGLVVQPDNQAILAALELRPPDRPTALKRLRALLAEVDRARLILDNGWENDPAANSLVQILARPEFQPAPPPNPVSKFFDELWESVTAAIKNALGPIISPITDRIYVQIDERITFESLMPVLTALGVLLIGGIAIFVARGFRRSLGPSIVGSEMAAADAAPATAAAARAEAEQLAHAGAFRAAIRALYLAALLHWDEIGKLRFDRTLTNREVLERASSQNDSTLVDRLAPLVDRFDRLWYGEIECSEYDYADFEKLASRAWETA